MRRISIFSETKLKLKKVEKVVDRDKWIWYYIRVADANCWKRIWKINKKVLDNMEISWYNIKAVADKKNDRNLDNWTVKHMKTKILLHSFNFKRTVQWTKTVKGIDSQVVILNLDKHYIREFDPGSGWTLAACLTHASRAKRLRQNLRGKM